MLSNCVSIHFKNKLLVHIKLTQIRISFPMWLHESVLYPMYIIYIICVCLYIFVCVCLYIHTYIYIYAYIYIYLYIYIYAYIHIGVIASVYLMRCFSVRRCGSIWHVCGVANTSGQ